MPSKKVFFWLAALAATDQLSKYFIPQNYVTKNSGLPFGITSPGFFSLAVIAVLLAVFVILYFRFFRPVSFGFALITAGALSNLIDRVHFGYVRDFINIGMATMNLADVMIWGGIIILILKSETRSTKY